MSQDQSTKIQLLPKMKKTPKVEKQMRRHLKSKRWTNIESHLRSFATDSELILKQVWAQSKLSREMLSKETTNCQKRRNSLDGSDSWKKSQTGSLLCFGLDLFFASLFISFNPLVTYQIFILLSSWWLSFYWQGRSRSRRVPNQRHSCKALKICYHQALKFSGMEKLPKFMQKSLFEEILLKSFLVRKYLQILELLVVLKWKSIILL